MLNGPGLTAQSTSTKMERIPVSGPWITQREIDYVTDAVTNAWYANANVYNARFEAAFAAYTGRKHAIALPSCTSALHLALLAGSIGPGDEVVVPDATWIASAAPISYVGATPVFADIDEKSWCLDAKSFESVITARTRAVIVVNLYGNMPDMDAIAGVAARHGVALIEDAAESVGSEYKGRLAGSFGLASTFSFHGSKTLTTGEGGMLLSDDTAFVDRCLFLRDHGRKPGDRMFFNHEVAHKYKMSSMQAALGLAQLERIDELVTRKREIFAWYREALAGTPHISLNHEAPEVKNTYWMVTAVIDGGVPIPKLALMSRLSDAGVDSRPFFHPLSAIPAYAGQPEATAAAARNVVSYRVASQGVNLPSGFNMTREKVAYVCDRLKAILSEAGGATAA
jgi:perosamine synthetase